MRSLVPGLPHVDLDVLIFGTGIAGLWTLGRLAEAGYHVLALESACIGNRQTISSQGIIHGGTKYLFGQAERASSAPLSAMPRRWRECFSGREELPLSSAALLCEHHYLWTSGGLAARVTGAVASRVVSGAVYPITREHECPEALRPVLRSGPVYRLDEPVLDVKSVLTCLSDRYGKRIGRYDGTINVLRCSSSNQVKSVTVGDPDTGRPVTLRARWLVLAAGAGNESLSMRLLNEGDAPPTQRRPLHMVMARGRELPPLFAHCIGAFSKPLVTVTTHLVADDERVWYLGGDLAESGVQCDEQEQIARAVAIMRRTLPEAPVDQARWSTVRIDRAEPAQPRGKRPEHECIVQRGNVLTVWPTKLALAPRLASSIIDVIAAITPPSNARGGPDDTPAGHDILPMPEVAVPPWLESDRTWNSAR